MVLADLELQREVRALYQEVRFFQNLVAGLSDDRTGELHHQALHENPTPATKKILLKGGSAALLIEKNLVGIVQARGLVPSVAEALARNIFSPNDYASLEGAFFGLFAYVVDYLDMLEEVADNC
jgi:hypothetical protein